jgi:16S rRNA (adenine1518-N6/adenine1519-N6)-dimethyltransferase
MLIKPKKRLGQNFLIDKNIQKKLIAIYCLKDSDHVLEIGAGYGELTKLIATNAGFIYAIEIDRQLCTILKENTKAYSNIKIINQDFLKFSLSNCFKDNKDPLTVIGNIPYYITTPIIEKLFNYKEKIKTIFIAVQKEFAMRVCADPGSKEYGSFSCFAQYHSIPKIHFLIKKTCFKPSPKVDSCLLELKIRQSPVCQVKDEKLFFKVIRTSFNQRRKTLRNSLQGLISKGKLNEFFKGYSIDFNIRPESLSLADFAHLSNLL